MDSHSCDVQPAEAYGSPGFTPTASIYDCLRKGLDANPDKVAFISAHQPKNHLAETISSTGPVDVDCLHWTYRQLNEASLKLATYLVQKCPPGKRRVATFVHHSIEQAIVYWAIAHIRGVFVPLDPALLEPSRKESRSWYCDTLKPDVVISWTYNNELESLLSTIVPDTVKISLEHGQDLPSTWDSLSSVLSSMTVASSTGTISHDTPADPTAIVQILFTSGTTARPKPVAHSAAQFTPWILCTATKIPPPAIYLATTANFRAIYTNWLLAVHQAGATFLVSNPHFTASTTLDAIIKFEPHLILFIPAQMQLIATEASKVGAALSSVRVVALSGDVVTADSVHLAEKVFPNATTLPTLATTETYGISIWPSVPNPLPSLPNSVVAAGLPAPGNVLRICSPGTFASIKKRGETGELWVAGQGVPNSYLDGRDPDHFRLAADLRGTERQWFKTGDTAVIDEKDQLYVSGRYKDVIVRAGINLSPVAIETAMTNLGYSDVHVVGVPHKILGSVPVAVIRTMDGGEEAKKHLIDGVTRVVGEDSKLERIWTLQDLGLDEWIANATGKVSKTDLQRKLLETVVDQSL